MMITQLQNQDPTQPANNDQLLAQMSQIGQLQSSTLLQNSITSMAQQSQIASAAGLMGKSVTGLDADGKQINGLVTSVKVQSDAVNLELDNGQTLQLSKVISIAPAPAAAAGAMAAAAPATTTAAHA